MEPIVFNGYYTLIAATIVLLVGRVLVRHIKFLRDFNIPEPVAGGLLAAAAITALYFANGTTFKFESSLQTAFMLFFFTSVGLSADFKRLKQGGMPLVVFLVIVSVFIVIQNFVGVGLAAALGQNPLMGLVTGSITLTGGHGTGAAYGKDLEAMGLAHATEMAMASATYGLVAGGLIGGPVARRLINKMGRKPLADTTADDVADTAQFDQTTFENSDKQRLITADSAIETMAMFAACVAFSALAFGLAKDTVLAKVPQFVWAILFGVALRNTLTTCFKKFDMFDRAIDVFGNASLSLFLAIALMSLKLWELAGLAGPMIVILLVQTVVMILYGYFVTARFNGNDYDSAVLAAGHCGFGLGATPTAVANMQSTTNTFGPSHKAFLIVPLVGAFFVDFVNFAILGTFIGFLG